MRSPTLLLVLAVTVNADATDVRTQLSVPQMLKEEGMHAVTVEQAAVALTSASAMLEQERDEPVQTPPFWHAATIDMPGAGTVDGYWEIRYLSRVDGRLVGMTFVSADASVVKVICGSRSECEAAYPPP